MSTQTARVVFNPPKSKMIGSIAIDVFEVETYSRSSKMTQYPIEDGSEISDHSINEPRELDIKAFVGVASVFNPFDSTARWLQAYDLINQLIDTKQLVTVVMGLDLFDDMHIESFEVERDATTSQGLPFNIRFKQAVFVTSQMTTIPNSKMKNKNTDAVVNTGKGNNGQTQTKTQSQQSFTNASNLFK